MKMTAVDDDLFGGSNAAPTKGSTTLKKKLFNAKVTGLTWGILGAVALHGFMNFGFKWS